MNLQNIIITIGAVIAIICLIVMLTKYKLRIRELKIKYQLEEKFQKGKINLKERGIKAKEYILFLKNKSPMTMVLFLFFIFNYFIYKFGSSNMFILNWFFFFLSYGLGLKVMYYLLEFTKITVIDFSKSPYEVAEYEMSYRMKRRFKFLDSNNKESILRNEYVDKDGNGYFVNEIDKANLIVRVNKIHNNIDIVRDIITAIEELEKYSTEQANENVMLKAKMNIETLKNTAKIMDKTNLLKQMLIKLENKELSEQYKKSENKADFIKDLIDSDLSKQPIEDKK